MAIQRARDCSGNAVKALAKKLLVEEAIGMSPRKRTTLARDE